MAGKEKRTWQHVLKYRHIKANQRTVLRYYRTWRKERGLPDRCDNPSCVFHTKKLEWNSEKLPLILDHESGNNRDNRPENLRYLCPNCDSQLDTRGGSNRGRVQEAAAGRFILLNRDGSRFHSIFIEEDVMASNEIVAEVKK
jgi:hypothetical protein